MKCMIVDDEEMAIKVMENHISKVKSLEVIAKYSNAMDAFSGLQSQVVDILFLDIQMPKMSGFSLLKSLPKYPHVILTTAHREFALESYDFTITDYLLKPISFERFLKAIGKIHQLEQKKMPAVAIETSQVAPPSFFYIKNDRQFVKIILDEVLYIESLRNHVKIVTSKENFTPLMGISELEEKLPPQHFLRIHRSFIIAIAHINQFSHSSVTVEDKILPIGSHYKNQVLQRLNQAIL